MLKAQAVADLALMLTQVTSPDRAQAAIRRAMRVAGLSHATELSDADMRELLTALAAEGGLIQDIAVQLATYQLEEHGELGFPGDSPTDKNAA